MTNQFFIINKSVQTFVNMERWTEDALKLFPDNYLIMIIQKKRFLFEFSLDDALKKTNRNISAKSMTVTTLGTWIWDLGLKYLIETTKLQFARPSTLKTAMSK